MHEGVYFFSGWGQRFTTLVLGEANRWKTSEPPVSGPNWRGSWEPPCGSHDAKNSTMFLLIRRFVAGWNFKVQVLPDLRKTRPFSIREASNPFFRVNIAKTHINVLNWDKPNGPESMGEWTHLIIVGSLRLVLTEPVRLSNSDINPKI